MLDVLVVPCATSGKLDSFRASKFVVGLLLVRRATAVLRNQSMRTAIALALGVSVVVLCGVHFLRNRTPRPLPDKATLEYDIKDWLPSEWTKKLSWEIYQPESHSFAFRIVCKGITFSYTYAGSSGYNIQMRREDNQVIMDVDFKPSDQVRHKEVKTENEQEARWLEEKYLELARAVRNSLRNSF